MNGGGKNLTKIIFTGMSNKKYRERYKRIGESEWFKEHYENKSLGETIEIEDENGCN